ncbi:MAG: hypothetical protein CMF96_09675 [Candidatus Marinimicrobia bacterium]|nr:hypothetical protein [Candidatus Neomarinimicrobiota bacterium]
MEFQIDTSKNLQELLKRLNPGSIVKGRILDKIDDSKYILRIYGYNIVTESKKSLKKGEELKFEIKNNNNHLTIKLIESNQKLQSKRLNIIV